VPTAVLQPFPRQTVRDLLGITRALYRAERHTDLPLVEERCRKLTDIGTQYQLALKLAKSGPGTADSRAAMQRVARATAALEEFVANTTDVGLLVNATAARLRLPAQRLDARK
jgi:hypothetical protein